VLKMILCKCALIKHNWHHLANIRNGREGLYQCLNCHQISLGAVRPEDDMPEPPKDNIGRQTNC